MKRWVIRISLCLILGAVTTVAVAWWCVWRGGPIDDDFFGQAGRPRLYPFWIAGGSLNDIPNAVYEWTGSGAFEVFKVVIFVNPNRDSPETYSARNLPNASRTTPPAWLPRTIGSAETVIGAGWPARALWGKSGFEERGGSIDESEYRTTHLLVLKSLPPTVIHGTRIVQPRSALPLGPIWPGFLINTLFYAAIWFGVFFGFTSAKRAIRRRRGRCPMCGYDLRGARVEPPATSPGCSECGWNRDGIDGQGG